MVRILSIDHLAIRVSDLARSKRFYDALLGFMGLERDPDGLKLEVLHFREKEKRRVRIARIQGGLTDPR